ncbi:hypothetical protein [Nocardioides sp. CER19]|uniref:hypothetical protein n=1 Tax=Nocardioides sp. CER19 TaxID=3038538 RepID=UPI00244B7BB7|nr:hypothetical protein [Nocardioides sp. CER19]MDH2416045.1 hypothetical protein [Nocardioides sp. CER19]
MGKKKSLKKADRALERLAAKLEKAESKARRWKAEAKRLEAEAEKSTRQLKKLRRRLGAARSAAAPVGAIAEAPAPTPIAAPRPAPASGRTSGPPSGSSLGSADPIPVAVVGDIAVLTGIEQAPAAELGTIEQALGEAAEDTGAHRAAAPSGGDRPDASWTVTALRVAAREQGVSGYSRRTKAELIRLLSE